MCGIFGYIGKRDNAAELVFEGIKTLEYRGYDSWGVAAVTKDGLYIQKQIGKIGTATLNNPPISTTAIAHTRWATHGGVTVANAHPHTDCNQTVAIIHNGIIENYTTLKKHLLNSHTFRSETDSEIVAHMIEELPSSLPFSEKIKQVFMQLEGSNALVAVSTKTHEIVAVRNGSPLVIGFGTDEQLVASDAAGLLPHTQSVYFLEDNEMAILTPSSVVVTHISTNTEKHITPTTLTWNKEATSKGAYTSFMEKELYEQVSVLTTIVTQTKQHTHLAEAITKARGTYLIGCGSAYYACLAGSYLFSTIASRHVNNCVASEFSFQEDFINDKSFVVALSQSGETMDLIDAIKGVKEKHSTIGSIVNVEGSTLWRLSDIPIPCGAGPEMAVASTKDLTAKLAHLLLTAYTLAGKSDEGSINIQHAIEEIQRILNERHHMQSIAKLLSTATHVFIVGRGLSYPAALEIAMKIKEISYIHAEGLPAGELKHGTIALIEPKTPCIVLAPNDETQGANIAAAMELKARGAVIIGISHETHEVFDHFIEVRDCKEATIIPAIVAGQVLALDITKEKHLDPDKPRNLAKSVTVK